MNELMNGKSTLLRLAVLVACQTLAFAGESQMPKGRERAAPSETTTPRSVEIRIEAAAASIGNKFLSWEMSLAEKRARTNALTNRRTGRTAQLDGEDFVLEFTDGRKLASREFQLDGTTEETTDGGGKRLVLALSSGANELSSATLRVNLITQLKPNEWWATRWLEVSGGSGELAAVTFGRWSCEKPRGFSAAGKILDSLGFPNECGQPLYVDDLFLALAHPGAQNFVRPGGIACRLPCYGALGGGKTIRTRDFVVGAGEAEAARRAFLGYVDATRATPARMIVLVNDWYWKDKSRPVEAVKALARVKQETGVPVDSFTLDDGWDMDVPIGSGTKPDAMESGWDAATGLWGRLSPKRFPGGWEALEAAGRPAGIGVSLWFGPIGGYSVRKKRIEFARTLGFEINGDKLCLAGPRYRKHVIESFTHWAERGMDYIKVDGFWPNCPQTDHGHLVGERGAIQQMDGLMEVFAAWRKGRRNLVIGYTSGSNPSPFWLQHCEFVWRSGADDAFAGVGEPPDRNSTFLDGCLQQLRQTEMPVSAVVTFDIVQDRIKNCGDEAFARNAWWLAARTSLHHDWYVQASDLATDRWKLLARVAGWAKKHEQVFRFGRMVGGDPRKGELYGFAAYDAGAGTLALRNPGDKPGTLDTSLAALLELPTPDRARKFTLRGVHGATRPLEGTHAGTEPLRIELPALAVAVFEVGRVGNLSQQRAPLVSTVGDGQL